MTRIALFGPTARGAATSDSAVDVLIAFDGPATSSRCLCLPFYPEDLLGCATDLITDKSLRPEQRPHIEQEQTHA